MDKLIVHVYKIDGEIHLCKVGVQLQNGMAISNGSEIVIAENYNRGQLDGAACNNFKQIVASSNENLNMVGVGDYFKDMIHIPEVVLLDFDNVNKNIKIDNDFNCIISEPRIFNISEVYDLCQLALATPCDSSKYTDSWCNEYLLKKQK